MDFAPNVVWCVILDNKLSPVGIYESLDESAGTITVSSYCDGQGSLENPRAPGCDDNGGRLATFERRGTNFEFW